MVELDFKRQKIGEILVNKKLITETQLEESLEIQKETGEKLGEILIRKGFISDEILVELISFQRGFDTIELSKIQDNIDPSTSNLISKKSLSI